LTRLIFENRQVYPAKRMAPSEWPAVVTQVR
jgi:hypothetical protein